MRYGARIIFIVLTVALGALPAFAESLDEVLERHYEAIGGLDAWRAVEGCRWKGRFVVPTGMESPFEMTFERPMKARIEVTTQGMTGIQAYDGETAWAILPFGGSSDPRVMPDEQAILMREQADLDGPLVDWKEKGHEVELLGKETIDGGEAYRLRVTLASGNVRDLFIDPETFLLTRQEATLEMRGEALEIETIYSDYRAVNGIVVAHTIESKPREAPSGQVLTIESVELDPEIPEGFFEMPGSAGPDGGEAAAD